MAQPKLLQDSDLNIGELSAYLNADGDPAEQFRRFSVLLNGTSDCSDSTNFFQAIHWWLLSLEIYLDRESS